MAQVAALDKAQVPKMKETLEQTEREMGEGLKAGEASEREHVRKGVAMSTAVVLKLRGQLAAMTPAERAAPAWLMDITDGMYHFAAPGTPGSYHLTTDDPAFYRVTGSPIEMRAILVVFKLMGKGARRDHFDRAIYDAYKTFDWAAVARMLAP